MRQLAGWAALPATVGGVLLKPEVRALVKEPGGKEVYAVTRIEATKAGPATVTFSAMPVALFIDGMEIKAEKELRLDLSRGTHTVAIRLDLNAMPDLVTLQSPDVTFRAE